MFKGKYVGQYTLDFHSINTVQFICKELRQILENLARYKEAIKIQSLANFFTATHWNQNL